MTGRNKVLSSLVVNQEKSDWYPTINMTWLGINLDFDNKIFSKPDKKNISHIHHNNKDYSVASLYNCSNII